MQDNDMLYHVYTAALLEYFHITPEQRRARMFGASMPGYYEICLTCIYYATTDFVFTPLKERLSRDSAFGDILKTYTHSDYVDAADFLCKIGLHEQQMVCMQLAHELAPSEIVSLRL